MTRKLLLTLSIALLSAALTMRADDAAALQLPQIPDSISAPASRAKYLAAHYWDNFDAQAAVAADSAALEQAFASYAWLLVSAGDGAQEQSAMRLLMSRASGNPKAYAWLCQNAQKYLYQPDSPTENLAAYGAFLQAIASDSISDLAQRQRNQYTLECIEMVMPGQPAPTFALADGSEIGQCAGQSFILLVFYDHDCGECKQLLADIEKSAYLNMLVADHKASVVLVDVADDNADTRIDDYLMRTVPSIYLLMPDATIALPDTDLKKALAKIAALDR